MVRTLAATRSELERLGHGVRISDDVAPDGALGPVARRVHDEQVPLELCLSSNLRTGCCAALEHHPLRRYFDAGALVTLNTDDPEMFQTTLLGEYRLARDAFAFSEDELRRLAVNSLRACWLPEERKRELLRLL